MRPTRLLSPALLALICSPSWASAQALVEVPVPDLGGACDDLDPAPLAEAIDREVAILSHRAASQRYVIGAISVSVADYAAKTLVPLAALARQGSTALCRGLATRFRFFRNPDAGAGKFTAYHNPVVRASRTRHGPYQHPLYRRPPGALANLTTAEILAGGLDGKGLELIYLSDATEALAVQVEGSATVLLDDNTTIVVGSAGHNGHPYTNVSKLLLADNKIPKGQVTPLGMTKARKYFIDHPQELPKYWGRNPHFVFFKETDKIGGRFGALTPGRSLAIDPLYIPSGAAVWIRTDMPAIVEGKVTKWVSYGRVALGQDAGAGIKGPGRVDVFFGTGDYAQQASAVTTRPGEIYVLLAK